MADTNEKICFVIAPIGGPGSGIRKRSDQVLEHIIRPVVESCGYKAVRADEIAEPGIITNQIIRHVVDDPLVIADLTGQNANVFYELAIRHAVRKPLVQIIDNVEAIPFDVRPMRTIGVDHRDLDSVEEAKTEIKRQIQSFEENSSSLENPISVALEGRSIDEINPRDQRYLEEIKKIGDKTDEILRRMNTEALDADPEEAKQASTNVGEKPTVSIDRAIARAISFQQQGKRDEAIEKWRAVAHVTEESDNGLAAGAWFSVGYLLENPEDSILAYNRSISLKPDLAEAYYNRGNAKAALGRYEDAIADYDEAISLKLDYANAYYNRGNAKAVLSLYENAIADFDKAIRSKPDLAEAYNNRGIAKGVLGRNDEAIADFDKAISLQQDNVNAYNNRGHAKAALGRYEDAIADYDEAISLQPDDVLAYNDRGHAKAALGRYEDAIADYDEAVRLQPDDVVAYTNRGAAKSELGQHGDAIADFDEAIRLKPDDVVAYYNRGATKGALGQYDEAIVDFGEVIHLKPDLAKAYYNRGVMKGALGRYDEARQDLETALELAQNANDTDLVAEVKQLLHELDADDT